MANNRSQEQRMARGVLNLNKNVASRTIQITAVSAFVILGVTGCNRNISGQISGNGTTISGVQIYIISGEDWDARLADVRKLSETIESWEKTNASAARKMVDEFMDAPRKDHTIARINELSGKVDQMFFDFHRLYKEFDKAYTNALVPGRPVALTDNEGKFSFGRDATANPVLMVCNEKGRVQWVLRVGSGVGNWHLDENNTVEDVTGLFNRFIRVTDISSGITDLSLAVQNLYGK